MKVGTGSLLNRHWQFARNIDNYNFNIVTYIIKFNRCISNMQTYLARIGGPRPVHSNPASNRPTTNNRPTSNNGPTTINRPKTNNMPTTNNRPTTNDRPTINSRPGSRMRVQRFCQECTFQNFSFIWYKLYYLKRWKYPTRTLIDEFGLIKPVFPIFWFLEDCFMLIENFNSDLNSKRLEDKIYRS